MNDMNPHGHDAMPPHPSDPHVQVSQQTSGLAITGLVLGILGFCFFPLSIAALILGIVALSQIADPNRGLTGRGMALTATILGGLGVTLVPVLLMIGIMLPALGAARRSAQKMKNTTQVRGIMQGTVVYGQRNGGYFPGLDQFGNPIDLTVEHRYAEMLNNNYFSGEYVISPAETKIIWSGGPVTIDNYSFSMLDVSEVNDRRAEWRDTINTRAALISDRNTGISNADQDVMSLHTSYPGNWEGSVGWGDGSAYFDRTHEVETKYGRGPVHQFDNIFEDTGGGDDAVMIYSGE